jgi:hypothetical protein
VNPCETCKYLDVFWVPICTHPAAPVKLYRFPAPNTEFDTCEVMRGPDAPCGPEGELYEAFA